MTVFQAVLIGFVYYFANSAWNASMGLYTLYRPLLGGLIVGVIMGDIETGLAMGLRIQFIFMGFMSTGGSMPSDSTLAGLLGTALAIMLRPTLGDGALDAALSMAAAIGVLGTFVFIGRMTWNTIFIQKAVDAAHRGDLKALFRWHVTIPQLVLATVTIIPITVFLLTVGNENILNQINQAIQFALIPLSVIGKLLPTLGLAITLNAIGKRNTIPFFFIGFVLSQYLKLDIIAITILGVSVAFLVYFGFNPFNKMKMQTPEDITVDQDDDWS